MHEPGDMETSTEHAGNTIFHEAWPVYNNPNRIVTLGHYYPQRQRAAATTIVRETRSEYNVGAPVAPANPYVMRQNLGWTKLVDAFNAERQWSIKRLFGLLDPMLESGISIAVVPTHIAYQAFWPMRTLARQLAEQGRVDATACLVRHISIKRITFGGPSTKLLHRQTIRVENPDLVAGKQVLLLDDIAKSGASLVGCREILLEAGASVVQALALGRVIVDEKEPQ